MDLRFGPAWIAFAHAFVFEGVRDHAETVFVKTHCLLRAAASLMHDEDKGSEGGRQRQGDWQQSPISGGRGLEVVCERDQ